MVRWVTLGLGLFRHSHIVAGDRTLCGTWMCLGKKFDSKPLGKPCKDCLALARKLKRRW